MAIMVTVIVTVTIMATMTVTLAIIVTVRREGHSVGSPGGVLAVTVAITVTMK